jgi:type IV pilus assembly protein PilA
LFWIAIVVGCLVLLITVLLIIAAVAIPNMLAVKKRADETSAIQTMRTIGSAEANYMVSYPSGYACALSVLGGDPKSGAPTATSAQVLDPVLAATGQKSGYTFSITCGSKITINNQDVYNSYEITGVPQVIGKTGDNGYCSDENNIVKVDPAGATNCTQSLQ